MSWIQEIVDHLRGGSRHPGNSASVLAIMRRDENADVLADIAAGAGWALEICSKYDAIKRENVPVILYDRDLEEAPGWRARIQSLASEYPGSAVILLSRDNDDHLWQEVIQLGGFDVLTKPFERTRVLRAIEFARGAHDGTRK